MDRLPSYSTIMTVITVVVTLQAIFVGFGIITERRNPASKLAWLLLLVLLPLAGLFFYLLFGRLRPAMRARAKRVSNEAFEEQILAPQWQTSSIGDGVDLPPPLRAVVNITQRSRGAAVTAGNSVDILSTGFSKFAALRGAIEEARDYIHVEYYIIRDDDTGRMIRTALLEAIERGVTVRLLLDGAGCFYVRDRFFDPLRSAGAQVAIFLPIRFPFLTSRRDFRNHRKLVVIDGREAFLGGMNIGDEYSGQLKDRRPWRDTHAHVTGPCVAGLDEVFAEDWFHATREPMIRPNPFDWDVLPGEQIVQVVASGPDRYWRTLQQVAFQVIAGAQRRVSITTPYFIPDVSILTALQTAALSGVNVRILVPARPNFPLLRAAQRSYYEELLASGVQIFEYLPGMIHAKTLEVDGEYTLIGSANMDIRSFRLNFELGLSVIAKSTAARIYEDFQNDLTYARECTAEDVRQRSRSARIGYSLAQMTSPLL